MIDTGLKNNEGKPMGVLVDGVDHVYVPMTDASDGFDVLTERLGLPVLWPFTSFGNFSSGGVSVGSIKLEVLETNPVTPWSIAQDPPQIQAIAFRPSRPVDDAYLAELDARASREHPRSCSSATDGRRGPTCTSATSSAQWPVSSSATTTCPSLAISASVDEYCPTVTVVVSASSMPSNS
jgi:hypothetical protein